jgi:CheY-like chemotaxis protein
MDLNNIFLISDSIDDINNNIVAYFIEITQCTKILLCYNDIIISKYGINEIEYDKITNILSKNSQNPNIIFNELSTVFSGKFLLCKSNIVSNNKVVLYLIGDNPIITNDSLDNSFIVVSHYLTKICVIPFNMINENINNLLMFVNDNKIYHINKKLLLLLEYDIGELYNRHISTIIDNYATLLNETIVKYITRNNTIVNCESIIIKISNKIILIMSTNNAVMEIQYNFILSQLSKIVKTCEFALEENKYDKFTSILYNVYKSAKSAMLTIEDANKLGSNIITSTNTTDISYELGEIINNNLKIIHNTAIDNNIIVRYNKKYSDLKSNIDKSQFSQLLFTILNYFTTSLNNTTINIYFTIDENVILVIDFMQRMDSLFKFNNFYNDRIETFCSLTNIHIKENINSIDLYLPIDPIKNDTQLSNVDSIDDYVIICANEFKILYIEDNICNIKLIKSVAEKFFRNATIYSALNACNALNMINENHFDLILTDLRLPDIHGTTIIEKIRQSSTNTQTPIIVISGESSREIIDKCKELGASDFITKPLNIQLFKKKIENYIERFTLSLTHSSK